MKKIMILIFLMFLLFYSSEAAGAVDQANPTDPANPAGAKESIAGLEKEVKGVLTKVSPSIVKVISQNHRKYVATGIVIGPQHVVTSMVIIRYPSERIDVQTVDGRVYPAQVVGKDSRTSLLVLKISENKLTPIKPAQSFETGDWVALVGAFYKKFPAIQQGILSSATEDSVILNAPVAPGASGGAVVNKKGELIGVIRGRFGYVLEPDVTFKDHTSEVMVRSPRNKSEELCFAVPAAKVKRIVDDLIKYGEIKRGWLGVSIIDVGKQVEVENVTPGSPADKCGIRKGDIVLAIGEKVIRTANDVVQVVRALRPGQKTQIKVLRNRDEKLLAAVIGETMKKDVEISLVKYPPFGIGPNTEATLPQRVATIPEIWQSMPQVENYIFNMSGARILGVEVITLTPELANAFKVKEGFGVMISKVHEKSAAAKAGLAAADIIAAVNGQEIKHITDLRRALAGVKDDEQAVSLKFYRDGQARELKVVPSKVDAAAYLYQTQVTDDAPRVGEQPIDDEMNRAEGKLPPKKPGEIIEIRDDYLYIDGKRYDLEQLKKYRLVIESLRLECEKYKKEIERLRKLSDDASGAEKNPPAASTDR